MLFENDAVTIITLFPCLSFTQTQIENDQWWLRFKISLVKRGRKIFDAFSERNLRFQIVSAQCGRGMYTH